MLVARDRIELPTLNPLLYQLSYLALEVAPGVIPQNCGLGASERAIKPSWVGRVNRSRT